MRILFSWQVLFTQGQKIKNVEVRGCGQSSISTIYCPTIWSAMEFIDRHLNEYPNSMVDLDVKMEDQTITVERIKKDYTVVLTF